MNEEFFKMSNTQENIWLINQHYPNTNINNIIGVIDFKKSIDIPFLKESINILVKRNEALRLRFKNIEGEILQYVEKYDSFDIDILEIQNTKEYIDNFLKYEFDLENDKLYYFEILKNKNGIKLVSRFHHIITDAWSLSLIISEITQIYSELKRKNEISYDNYYNYTNYILDEKKYMSSDRYFKDQKYWNEIFNIEPQILNFKSDNINKIESDASRKEINLDKDTSCKINKFCKDNSISPYCLFLTCAQLLISKKYNMEDVIIGNPLLNRKNKQEKESIGMFINTLPIRLKTDYDESIISLLKKNSRIILNTLRHERYPYHDILDFVKEKYQINQNLYSVLFSYQNARDNRGNIDVEYSTEWIFNKRITDDIQIHIHDRDNNGVFSIVFDYKKCIFNDEEIINISKLYIDIINQTLENKELKVREVSNLYKDEIKKILNDFNNKKLNIEKELSYENIYNLLVYLNKSKLENIALEYNNKKITYRELFHRVDKLVSYLYKQKIIKEKENVGIIVNKDIDTIIGILAILKMNCTIVPIDSNYPIKRQEYMIKNAEVKTLLYTKTIINDLNVKYKVDVSYKKYIEEKKLDVDFKYNANDNLYIIYTSGSTGNPKPVCVSHKNIINLIVNELKSDEFNINNSRILQFATLSFDVSYQEIFTAFISASTLVLIDDKIKKDNNKLSKYIIDKEISILFIPPKYLIYLAENNKAKEFKKHLKHIITAGEQLIITNGIKQLINDDIVIHNHYGPAETHVATTYIVNKEKVLLKPPIRKTNK